MATTPEGRVKAKVSALLKATNTYYRMPVPSGFGSTTVDYEGCSKGRFFCIETKAPGVNEPKPRQRAVMDAIERSGGRTFFINNTTPDALKSLADWLAA